jgi:hypothetical protein
MRRAGHLVPARRDHRFCRGSCCSPAPA